MNILLIGCNGFLGQELNQKLLENGYNVFGVDVCDFDISNSYETEKYLKSLNVEFDGLVNNAAVSFKGKNISDDKFEKTLNINVFGSYNVIQNILQKLKDNSSIVNIASVYGLVVPHYEMYCGSEEQFNNISYGASKAAILQMTKIMAVQLAPRGIRVNAVSPGGIRGEQTKEFIKKYSERVPMKRMVEKSEVANCVVFLLSNLSSGITGQNITVDGGLSLD